MSGETWTQPTEAIGPQERDEAAAAQLPAVPTDYEKPEAVGLGSVAELTRNSSSGPFTDGSSDGSYRWKAG